MGGQRTNLLPILKNSFASRRRLEFCRTWTAGRSPAGTLVVRVEDLVYAGCHFAGVRSTSCDRIHLFGSRIRIDGEVASGMRPDTARLWKTECISISNQDCISQHACGHWSTIHDATSQLPRSRQSFVILLRAAADCAVTPPGLPFAQPAVIATTARIVKIGITLIIQAFCSENSRLSSPA